jgi:hypothetical protein
MSDVVVEAVSVQGGASVVAEDIPCFQCSYNLRGLAAGGQCPECNAAIAHSLHGTSLRYAGREYLRKLHRGLVLVILSMLTGAVLQMGYLALMLMGYLSAGNSMLILLAVLLLPFGFSVAAMVGYYLYVTPWVVASQVRYQTKVRSVLLIVLGLELVLLIVQRIVPLMSGYPVVIGRMGRFSFVSELLLEPAIMALVLYHTRELAERLEDESLVASTRKRMWIPPSLLAALAFMMFFAPIFAALHGVVSAMIYVPYLFLLNRTRGKIRGLLRERHA